MYVIVAEGESFTVIRSTWKIVFCLSAGSREYAHMLFRLRRPPRMRRQLRRHVQHHVRIMLVQRRVERAF